MVPRLLEQGRETVSGHDVFISGTETWWRANCSCGWRGFTRPLSVIANADADEHMGRAVKGSADYIQDAGRRVDKILNSPRHPVEQG